MRVGEEGEIATGPRGHGATGKGIEGWGRAEIATGPRGHGATGKGV